MHSRHDEYHKLTRGERIGYGMGDFAQNLVFGTIGGFLCFAYADGKYHQHGNGRLYFSFVRIINVLGSDGRHLHWDKRTSKAGKYRPRLLQSWRAAGDPVGITVRAYPGVKVQWLLPLLFIWRWTRLIP